MAAEGSTHRQPVDMSLELKVIFNEGLEVFFIVFNIADHLRPVEEVIVRVAVKLILWNDQFPDVLLFYPGTPGWTLVAQILPLPNPTPTGSCMPTGTGSPKSSMLILQG